MARAKIPCGLVATFFVAMFINNTALTSPQFDRGLPTLREIPSTKFSCQGRTAGYYADSETECQAYHMCDTLEQKFSYMCPGYTLFNQKFMVCDHWNAVNCSISHQFYDLNNKIGQVPGAESAIEESSVIKARKKSSDQEKLFSVFKINVGNTSPALKPTTTLPAISKIKFTITPPTTKRPPKLTNVTSLRPLINTVKPLTKTAGKLPLIASSHSSLQFLPITIKAKAKVPSLSARGTKFKFGITKSTESEEGLKEIKFRPLFKASKREFIDKRNFTVPPNVFGPTSPSPIGRAEGKNKNKVTSKTDLNAIKPIVPFLIPPLIESPSLPPPTPKRFLIPPVRDTPSLFLLPPAVGPVNVEGRKQELRTPLVVSNQFFGRQHRQRKPLKGSNLVFPRLPFLRSNRDFFIPSSGLLPPIDDNSLSDNEESPRLHKMTMTFPNMTMTIQRRRPPMINPKCPRCHPAFLKPNECHPCVIIK